MDKALLYTLREKFKPIPENTCLACGGQVNKKMGNLFICKKNVCINSWQSMPSSWIEYVKEYDYVTNELHDPDFTDETTVDQWASDYPLILINGNIPTMRRKDGYKNPEAFYSTEKNHDDEFEKTFESFLFTEKNHAVFDTNWGEFKHYDYYQMSILVDIIFAEDITDIKKIYEQKLAISKIKDQIDRLSRIDYNVALLQANGVAVCRPSIYKFTRQK